MHTRIAEAARTLHSPDPSSAGATLDAANLDRPASVIAMTKAAEPDGAKGKL